MWDAEWLSKGAIEEILDPEVEIVDTHIHLWADRERFPDYAFPHFKADAEDGHRVTAAVYVDCGSGYRTDGPEHLRPVGETETVVSVAEENPFPKIAGIVAFADLAGSQLTEIVDAHVDAGRGLFKGVRQMLAHDEDSTIPQPRNGPSPHLMERDDWRAGLAWLGERNMTFDAFVYHPQLPKLAAAARAVPGTNIILDHLGSPVSIGRFAGRRSEVLAEWKDSMSELSECPNVVVKIGGIGWPPMGGGFEKGEAPPTSAELADAWEPFVSHALSAFGPTRCLAESNFPMDQQTTTYRTLWNALKRLVGDLPREDQQLVMAGTARRVYGL
jgi:predicted TIM-barrel fold metal-dependent hydrolase